MKINLKIILPIIVLLCIILAAFGYLLYYLSLQEQSINNEANKFRQLNTLSQRLSKEQEVTEYNVLVYRFNQNRDVLARISQSEFNKAQTIDEIYPFITDQKGHELVDKYISSRRNIDEVRADLISAIDSKDQTLIRQRYDTWSVQTESIRQAIEDINAYNVKSLEEILGSFKVISDQLVLVIIVLFVIVSLATFILFYYLKYAITNPIIRLSQYAYEISNKNFTNIMDDNMKRQDEIGTLFNDFTVMSKNLRDQYKVLEQNVKDRTYELTNRTKELENSQKATLNILEDLSLERKALLETKALDEAILASIGEGLAVVDLEGRITYINDAFTNITGWTKDEAFGQVLVDLIPSESEKGELTPNEHRFISKILRGEDPEGDLINTVYYVRKDKTRFPVNSLVKRITLDGRLIGAVKTFRDVTEEKAMDKAKTEFVSLAAHQLRTPLSAISWYTEMLLDGDAGELGETQRKYLEQIYNGNQRMIGMVKSFLNVSRIDLGTMQIDKEPTDLGELIQGVIDEQKQKIVKKEINFEFTHDQALPLIEIDPKRVRMVFQNLVSNAIKYTPEKGKISVNLTVDNDSILTTVSDTGYGIPEESKQKIFSKLFRADNVIEKSTEGTGLGLYIAKNIIDNSGGKIWFESEENKGTKFFVTLPL